VACSSGIATLAPNMGPSNKEGTQGHLPAPTLPSWQRGSSWSPAEDRSGGAATAMGNRLLLAAPATAGSNSLHPETPPPAKAAARPLVSRMQPCWGGVWTVQGDLRQPRQPPGPLVTKREWGWHTGEVWGQWVFFFLFFRHGNPGKS